MLEQRFGSGTPPAMMTDPPSTIAGMLSHASCRSFDGRPIEPSMLTTVLAAALSAPSKSDLQQVTIIHLQDHGLRNAVTGLVPAADYSWLRDAAEVLVFCGDNRRIRLAAAARGRPFPNTHLDQFMNAAGDAAIALGSAVIAAESLGLGTCPLSELRDEAGALIELLELPEGVFPFAGLALGWPSSTEQLVGQRLPYPVLVQTDTYSDAPFLELAGRYEEERDRREARPDEAQRSIDEYGVVRPYGWGEDRTRQYAHPIRADWSEHIGRQGFDLD
jgi:nitroreductase